MANGDGDDGLKARVRAKFPHFLPPALTFRYPLCYTLLSKNKTNLQFALPRIYETPNI